MSILDWIRWDSKHSRGGSIIWKALIQAFKVIGNGLAWRVGNGQQFIIGKDPWGNGNYRALPLIITWGIWIARNRLIFDDKWTEPDIVAAQCIGTLQHFPQLKNTKPKRRVGVLELDKSIPWAFFDGPAQGNPLICGGGGIIYWSDQSFLVSRAGLGEGSNNYAEVMSLKLILLLAVEKNIRKINIMGDSLLIINWANKHSECHTLRLRPILEEIHLLVTRFDHISFSHVYREQNELADKVSKEAMGLHLGVWQIEITADQNAYGYYHRPFHEI